MLPASYLGKKEISLAIETFEFLLGKSSCDGETNATLEKPWLFILVEVFTSKTRNYSQILFISNVSISPSSPIEKKLSSTPVLF